MNPPFPSSSSEPSADVTAASHWPWPLDLPPWGPPGGPPRSLHVLQQVSSSPAQVSVFTGESEQSSEGERCSAAARGAHRDVSCTLGESHFVHLVHLVLFVHFVHLVLFGAQPATQSGSIYGHWAVFDRVLSTWRLIADAPGALCSVLEFCSESSFVSASSHSHFQPLIKSRFPSFRGLQRAEHRPNRCNLSLK